MLAVRGTNGILLCIFLCVLLFISVCTANISFGLVPGTKAVKGSQTIIICDLGDTFTRVDIYTTNTLNTAEASALTSCSPVTCLPAKGHTFNQTATSVTITISVLRRDRDEKWWTCIDQNGENAQFNLTVFTEPLGAEFSSAKACDLSKEACSFTCQTSSCTYPDPSFHLFYFDTTEGATKPLFGNFVNSMGSSGATCIDKENIYSVPIMIPINTTFPGNLARTITLECRVGFDTLGSYLSSQQSDPVQFAVSVKKVHISPESESSISIVENKKAPVSCITSGSRPAATVTWFLEKKGQSPRQLGRGNDQHSSEDNDQTVTKNTLMLNTTRDYQGWKLSCQATSFGTKKVKASNPKELNILYPTSIKKFIGGKVGESQSSGSVTVNEYENVTGECQVDSNPNSSIEISQRGRPIAKADKVNVLAFQVLNTTCLDNGEMICKGWNDIADSTAAIRGLQLHVRCSPRLEYKTNSIIDVRQGTSAVMSLSIIAFPAPTSHQWQRLVNGKWLEVRNTPSFMLTSASLQYSLTVMNVTRHLYGSYNLTLANGVGSPLIVTFKLQKGKPEVPTDIAVSVVSSTVITVFWTAGYDGEVEQSFYIQYKSSDAQDWITKEVADHKSDERMALDLDGLTPATDYMLRIFAANAEGNSSLSETLMFRMKMKVADADAHKDTVSTGAVVGGVVAGVLAIVVIALLLLLFRRNNRLQACRKQNRRRTTNHDPSSAIGNVAVDTAHVDNVDSTRPSSNAYDDLNTETEAFHTYTALQEADPVSPTQRNVNKKEPSRNVYDDLNTEAEAAHTYTALQADPVSPTQRHGNKQDSQKMMYYNVSDTKRPLKNQGSSSDAPSTSSGLAIAYSNLKFADE